MTLDVDAPGGCIDGPAVTAAVERLVRTSPSVALQVSARVTGGDEHWLLSVAMENGERLVEGESCAALQQALIVMIALAIDPRADVSATTAVSPAHAEDDGEGARATGSTAVLAPPAAGLSAAPKHQATSGPRAPLRAHEPLFGASLLWSLELGALPALTYGASGAIRIVAGAWRGEVLASVFRPQWVQLEGSVGRRGGYISLLATQGNACHASPWFLTCLGAELGRLTGEGRALSADATNHALWLAGVFSIVGRAAVAGGAAAEARLGLAIPAFRPNFSIDPYPPLHRPAAVSGRLSFGLAWH